MSAGRARALRRAAIAAAILVVLVVWAVPGRSQSAIPTAAVHREDLVMTVAASGELDAVRSSLIGPPPIQNMGDFKISFMAPESRTVRKGDPILAFDTTNLAAELQRRRVEYEVAVKEIEKREAALALQVSDLEQQLDEAESRLRKSGLKAESPEDLAGLVDLKLARLDVELEQKEVASLTARIEGARRAGDADLQGLTGKREYASTRIREIEEAIARMRIAAPQDGIVIYQTDWQGDKKKVGDSVWTALKVMKIPDLGEMMGRADVDEADAGRLRAGQSVKMRLDALPDAEITGKLSGIGRVVQQASRGSELKVYKVEFSLDRTDTARMRPGMRLRAEIEIDRAASALVVPRDAVFLRPGGPVVFVRRGARFTETPVRIGRRNGSLVEVLDGASEGDLVALRDPSRAGEAPS